VGRARVATVRACLVAAALAAATGAWGAEPDAFRLREPGEKLPAITLQDLGGVDHLLGPEGRGPCLLFFWSVFCPNCKEAIPGLVELYRAWGDRGLTVWAVNVDGDRFSNAVQAYLREAELPFPVVYDRLEGDVLLAADPLGVTKTPTLYLAKMDGEIALRQVIEIDFPEVARVLADLAP